MKISIALATYNGERWLCEQLDSLAAQTLLPFELVVSDDQSTDRTLEIIGKFAVTAPFPVRIIPNTMRVGFADNFIRALRNCKGDYIAYCDQDDVWAKLKLERCVSYLHDHPEVLLLHHSAAEVDQDLRPLGVKFPANNKLTLERGVLLDRRYAHHFVGCCMMSQIKVVEAMLNCWPSDHRDYLSKTTRPAILSHDLVTLDIATALGYVAYLPDVLVQHRRHTNNTLSASLGRAPREPFRFSGKAAALKNLSELPGLRATLYKHMAQSALEKGDEAVSRQLLRLAGYDFRLSVFRSQRSFLYDTATRRARWHVFLIMLRDRIYGGSPSFGIGLRSALKDFVFVLAGNTWETRKHD